MVAAGGGGRIVNVTSVHEHVPLEGSSAYTAAKHGLGGLTKVMALELAEHGITVNAVAPGEIATKMTGNEDVDPRGEDRPGIPAGRPGHAREIGATVAFLASGDAGYVTGQSFVVDGGMLLMAARRTSSPSGTPVGKPDGRVLVGAMLCACSPSCSSSWSSWPDWASCAS